MRFGYRLLLLANFVFSHSILAEPTNSTAAVSLPFYHLAENTITLATHIEPPLVYFENDVLKGTNIEVARLLAKHLNLSLQFTQCPFARCLSLLESGQVDMMVGINKTKPRQSYLSYLSQPYNTRTTPVRFYLRKDADITIDNYDDLAGLSVGVLRGASFFERFDNDTSLYKLEVTTHKQLIDMLLKGRFDTFLGREISIRQHISADIYQNEMKLAPYIYKKKNDSYIVLSKASNFNEYLELFSQTLNELIAQGEIKKITNKYGNHPPKP